MTRAIRVSCCAVVAGVCSAAEPVDESKLPPPAQVKIDFDRDVRPVFEGTCWRCHGPERPKSHFRLDNRESALKGGENGVDILPGDSAKSPLIHYVARLVPDMEMPPEGKGEPLTATQVSLFRAWIDQGAPWGTTNPPVQTAFSLGTTLRWIGVEGDKAKFREIEGVKEGFGGGVQEFSMTEQLGPDKKFTAEGRVLFPDHDALLKLELRKTDVGFVRGGVEQWRKYYDDTGGYYRPFPEPSFNLGQDLYLDIGRAWIDVGLTPPGGPQVTLGYEYQFRNGTKSLLDWGDVGGGAGKAIYPTAENIDEHTHILKFDLTHELFDWQLEDNARVEFYGLNTSSDTKNNLLTYTNRLTNVSPQDGTVSTREGASHIQGQNTLHIERQFVDGFFVSGAYYYSRFDGDASFAQTTVDAEGAPMDGLFWSSDEITLARDTQSFSLSALIKPWDTLNISAGVQPEWIRQESFGRVHFDEGDPNLPGTGFVTPTNILRSGLDTEMLTKEIGARFTALPWTVLFAEARWAEERISQIESQTGSELAFQDPEFQRDTEFRNDRDDYRAGFNTSPWRTVSLSADYRRQTSDSDYLNQKSSDQVVFQGYSAFIKARSIDTDGVQTRLAVHPANWVKFGLTYQRTGTDYRTATDPVVQSGVQTSPGGGILAGRYDAHVYGINATFRPIQRLYFSGAFTYSDSLTKTANNGDPSIAQYKGHIYTAIANAGYAFNAATELNAFYSWSKSDYGQANVADGLPLGLDFTRHGLNVGLSRRLTRYVTSSLRYSFYQYLEPSTGGFNDYTAHGVFATVVFKWP